MADIFINYRTNDGAWAILLDEKLSERFGADAVFRDSRSIAAGEDFRPELWGALARSTVFIAVIGENWLSADEHGHRMIDDPDDFVRREISLALRIGVKVIPVLAGNVPPLRAEQLPTEIAELAHRQYRRLSSRGAHREIIRFVDDVADILAEAPTRPASRPTGPGRRSSADQPRTSPHGVTALLRIDDIHDLPPDAARTARQARLRAAIEVAGARAGVPGLAPCNEELGTGIRVPPAVPPSWLVTDFLEKLDSVLAEAATGSGVVPVRVAGCRAGTDHGGQEVFSYLAQMMNMTELGQVLRQARRARLVLVIPDSFYDQVVRRESQRCDLSTFLPVAHADGARYWLQVPGYPAPPGLAAGHPPPPADSATDTTPHTAVTGSHATVMVNNGTQRGPWVAGDLIMGSKHLYGTDPRLS